MKKRITKKEYELIFKVNPKTNKSYLDSYFEDTEFAEKTKSLLKNDIKLNNDLQSKKGLRDLNRK